MFHTSLRLSVRIALWCMAPVLAAPLLALPVNGVFHLMRDDQDLGYFTEASAIGSISEVIVERIVSPEGKEQIEKNPGRLSPFPLSRPLTLRRAMGDSRAIWTWRQMVVDGDVNGARASVTLTQLDETGAEVARWSFQNGWPSKVGGTTAPGGDMMEEIMIVHEGGERVPVGDIPSVRTPGESFPRFGIEAGEFSTYFDSFVVSSEHEYVDNGVGWIPGRLKFDDIILSRPLNTDASLWAWRRLVETGDSRTAKRDIAIIAYEADGSERARWSCTNGWPFQLEVRMLPDSPAVETLHLAIEGMTLENSSPAILLPSSFHTPVGSTAQFAVTASDPDSDPVALTQLTAPAGSSFVAGTFSWHVPVSAVETTALVTFRANDQRSEPNSIVTNSLTITIPRDYDTDSMDDDWEVIWFGSIGNDPDGDKDGDGATNLSEFLTATSPVDSASRFKVNRIAMTSSGAEISYIAEPGMQYQLETNSTGLDRAGWSLVGAPWTETSPASTLRMLVDDTASMATVPAKFYRISARRP